MDRQIVYAGSIPLDTDLLYIQRHVMASIGALARVVLGDGGLVDGLACAPGFGAYTVIVGPGSYLAPLPVDGTSFGSLPADGTPLVQIALHPADSSLQLGPPPDGGHVLCWLVQAAIGQVDAGPMALPYWNAADPSVPFSGPGNSGTTQPTQRQLRVLLSVKASGPEVGAGVPPPADPGWVGLYGVTTYAGKPGIEQSDIVAIPDSPMLRYRLPVLPPGFTRTDTFGVNGSWRAPMGVRTVRVRAVGAGGGGGGGDTSYSGGGGGAGGYAESLIQVVPGQSYAVVIGAGGSAGVSGGPGGTGGDTGFGLLVHATGGQGGGSANPDSHGGAPGAGTNGVLLQAGGYGGDGAMLARIPGGTGGASAFGGGGRGADEGGLPAYGLANGSGGGGGYGTNSAGGYGAGGLVVIEY